MRKLKLLAIAAALLLIFCACNKDNAKDPDAAADPTGDTSVPVETGPVIPQTAKVKPANTDELYEKWISLGVVSTDKRYYPVSNAQLCQIINKILHYDCDGTSHYYDVMRQDSYYYDVMSIDAMGILTSNEDYYYPDDPITRERAMVALARAFAGELPEAGTTSFTDDSLISDWARSACLLFDQNHWYVGDALRPQDELTESELLWMLDRIVNDIVSSDELSGTYTSGIVITDGDVTLTDATVKGNIYILAGYKTVSLTITDSTVTGSIYIGRGVMRESESLPSLTVNSSTIGGVVCDYESSVYLDANIADVTVNKPTDMHLGDNAVVDFMLVNSAVTVSGSGGISMAVITYEGTGSSFSVAPKVYLDAPGGYYSGGEKGFVDILGHTYLVGDSGELYTGFVIVDGNEYYFDADGIMATGTVVIDGASYKFDDNGVLISGFMHKDGNTYYYDLNGMMYTGIQTIGENEYIFDQSGILLMGKYTFEGSMFITDSNGAVLKNGVIDYEGETYVADEYGKLITGLVNYNDENHWFDPETGAMMKSCTVDSYTIDENGVITNYDSRISSGDEELDGLLDEIIAQVCTEDMSLEEQMLAVYDWTKDNIKYRATDIDLSNGYTPELIIEHGRNTLDTRRGACEHFAIVNALLFNRLGVETILIQGQRHSLNYGDWADHTWVLGKTDDLWYHYDALFEQSNLGIEMGAFKKTDDEMTEHHTWTAEDYPVCDGVTTFAE